MLFIVLPKVCSKLFRNCIEPPEYPLILTTIRVLGPDGFHMFYKSPPRGRWFRYGNRKKT